MNIIEEIYHFGIVPVVAIDDVAHAAKLAHALSDSGLALAEITYRTPCANDAIIEMKRACPDMLIGAGTILTTQQVDSAIQAGAQFIVSPGLNPEIVEYCQKKKIIIIPGCATPSDMERALALGLTHVKFFPAEANGGIRSIKAMSAPYHQLSFMPTGGVNENNLKDYLDDKKIFACGGSWMVASHLVKAEKFKEIKELSKQAILKMLDLQIENLDVINHLTVVSTLQIQRALFHFNKMGIALNEDGICESLRIKLIER